MNRDLKEGTVKAKMKPRGRAFQAEEQHMQGPEAGVCVACWRGSEQARVAGANEQEEACQGVGQRNFKKPFRNPRANVE